MYAANPTDLPTDLDRFGSASSSSLSRSKKKQVIVQLKIQVESKKKHGGSCKEEEASCHRSKKKQVVADPRWRDLRSQIAIDRAIAMDHHWWSELVSHHCRGRGREKGAAVVVGSRRCRGWGREKGVRQLQEEERVGFFPFSPLIYESMGWVGSEQQKSDPIDNGLVSYPIFIQSNRQLSRSISVFQFPYPNPIQFWSVFQLFVRLSVGLGSWVGFDDLLNSPNENTKNVKFLWNCRRSEIVIIRWIIYCVKIHCLSK